MITDMPPRDNWSPLLIDEPQWYYNYIDFIDANLYEVQQLIDESEVDFAEYGYDGWDSYLDTDTVLVDIIIMVPGSGTREDPIDLTGN